MNARALSSTAASLAVQTLAVRILAALAGVGTGIVIARAWGPDGKGVYSAVQAAIAIPAAVSGGGAAAITFFLVRMKRGMSRTLPLIVFCFGGTALVLCAAAVAFGTASGWNAISVTFAAAVPAALVLSLQASYYVSTGRIRRLNAQMLALPAGILCCCAIAWLLRARIEAVLAAYVLCTYAFALAVAADMWRDTRSPALRTSRDDLREFVGVAAPSGFNTALGALNYRIDSYIVVALAGVSVFGVYSIAVNVGEMLLHISRSIATVATREIGASAPDRAARFTACSIRVGAALSAIFGAALFALAPPLLHAIFGSRFESAATPLRILIGGIVAFSSAPVFASYFIVQLGRPHIVTLVNCIMLAVQAGACVLLVPRFGIAGAAGASSCAYAVGAVLFTSYFCSYARIAPSQVWILQGRDLGYVGAAARDMLGRRPLGEHG
jgi:O-antigen/teichoic acid export membrane protein